MVPPHELPSVLWLGGGNGAGKTTIARTIALRFDFAFYRIDAHAYEHRDRLIALGVLEPSTQDHDRRWLDPTPAELARQFVDMSEKLFPLILDDLRMIGTDATVVVEGPQLFPALISSYLADTRHGLWLLPTEEFQRRALEARTGNVANFTTDVDRARNNLLVRNRILADRIRDEATGLGLEVLDVDVDRDLRTMTEDVSTHVAIDGLPAVRIGAKRSRMRQAENDAMVRNFRAFLHDVGSAASLSDASLPFSCECENLGCEWILERTMEPYDELRGSNRPLVGH